MRLAQITAAAELQAVTLTPEAPVRAQLLIAGLVLIAGACSTPDADRVDATADERNASPDLALSTPSEAVPVASDVEVGQPAADPRPDPGHPSPEEEIPQPEAEPLGSDLHGEHNAAPAISVEPMPVATSHVHPKAPDEALSEAEEGGGKPTGVSTGLGPVPDRNWGDPGIMDDPNPIPDVIGRAGAVIIRGGAGGVHDDCKIHPRGGTIAGPTGPGALVNDRDPRRGALINERAPRTSRRPALPRGSGFPGGGLRGGFR
jgi:hypothetical protein